MIINQDKQFQIVRENGKIHREIAEIARTLLIVGNNWMIIEAMVKEQLAKYRCESAFLGQYDFPAHCIININDTVVHGVPNTQEFQEWDVVTFDFGVKRENLLTDAAFTVVVGGWFPEKQACIDVANEALQKWIQQARVWNTSGDIWSVIYDHVTSNGYYIIRDLTGHGLGTGIHEKPTIYNFGKPGQGARLKKGMYICIEPIVGYSTDEIFDTGNFAINMVDGWFGVQEEHCGIVGEDGFEIIA